MPRDDCAVASWARVVPALSAVAMALLVAPPALAVATLPTITDVPCDTGTGSSADGRVTNPGPDPVEVVVAGPDRVIVGGRLEQGADPLAVVLEPGEQVVTFVGVVAGDVVTLTVGGEVVDEVAVGDCRAAVSVAARVDADLDGVFGRDEAGPAPGGPAVLDVVVTNRGVPASIELRVSTGGEPRVVFGTAPTSRAASCELRDTDGVAAGPLAASDLVPTGWSATCTVVMPTATPATGRSVTRTVTAVASPPGAAPARATDTVTISTTTDVVAALVVEVTTDADGDGTATDVEFAPGPGADVLVRVEVENPGPSDGAVRLTLLLPDGSTVPVIDDGAPAGLAVTCLDTSGSAVGAGDVVAAGTTVVCELTLPGFSPSVVAPKELTVLGELLTASGDLDEQLVLATATDDTAVSSVLVLDETVEGDDEQDAAADDEPDGVADDDGDGPGTTGDADAGPTRLADGGAESVVLVVGGLLGLLLGVLALLASRSTDRAAPERGGSSSRPSEEA